MKAFELRRPPDSVRMIWAFRKVSKHTGVDVPRLKTLWVLSRKVDQLGIQGDIVECGVWNGGTAGVMASASRQSNRHFWLFDSFQGFPKPTEKDFPGDSISEGEWQGNPFSVLNLFRKLSIDLSRVHIVPGWFKDTLPSRAVNSIALLHIDADLYESVKCCLENMYERVVPGGFVVLDDYGFWPGCRRAVDEFLNDRCLEVLLVASDCTGYWFQKPFSTTITT